MVTLFIPFIVNLQDVFNMHGDWNSLNTWSTIRLSVLETTNPFIDVAYEQTVLGVLVVMQPYFSLFTISSFMID
jgi:hypothetical protein